MTTAIPTTNPKTFLPPVRFLVVARNINHYSEYVTDNKLDARLYCYAGEEVLLLRQTLGDSLELIKLPGWRFDKSDAFISRITVMEAEAAARLN